MASGGRGGLGFVGGYRAFGHNYIGTEHLLLGLLATDDPVGAALDGLGLTLPRAEAQLATELAGFQARREQA